MTLNMTGNSWHAPLCQMLNPIRDALLNEPEFHNNAFDLPGNGTVADTCSQSLDLLVGESIRTLDMIGPLLRPGIRVLEVGGGVGLTYAILKAKGIDIVSLEPGGGGFGNRHRAGLCLMDMLSIDSSNWLSSPIENFIADQPFDLVFSHFVLEHIPDIEKAFLKMNDALRSGGQMIHRCPNYFIPFEPHLNIPLVPFFPKCTAFILPNLKDSVIWRGLQFTSVPGLKKLCRRVGMQPSFRRGMTAWALEQLFIDESFANRKRFLSTTAKRLKRLGLIHLVGYLPPLLDTPVEFVAQKV